MDSLTWLKGLKEHLSAISPPPGSAESHQPELGKRIGDRFGVLMASDYAEPIVRAIGIDGVLAADGASVENVRQADGPVYGSAMAETGMRRASAMRLRAQRREVLPYIAASLRSDNGCPLFRLAR